MLARKGMKYLHPSDYTKKPRLMVERRRKNPRKKYIYFIDKEHPFASKGVGRVYWHRHLASVKLGRWLRPEEDVHHIDGNSLNNDPDNLEVLSRSEHTRRHHQERVKAGEYETLNQTLVCDFCSVSYAGRYRYEHRFCSQECYYKAKRKFVITAEELQKIVWEKPTSILAKELGVSDVAIAKRCKKFGIKKPPRGYWAKKKVGKI